MEQNLEIRMSRKAATSCNERLPWLDETARVLIVDDEPFMRDLVSRWLRPEGYDCSTAASAEDAWDLLQRDGFSLVISDIRLPAKSGIDLLETIKNELQDVAVLMVTGVDDRKTAIRALELGAYGYVVKPLEQNEVIINVINALGRRRLSLEAKEQERMLQEKVRRQTEEIRVSREEIALRLIAAQEYRHDETGAHIRRIGLYAETVSKAMGYTEEHTEMLRLTAPMHDVGKIGIPDSILLKPARLTPQEWDIMKRHTAIGAQILGGKSVPHLRLARDIALSHHEKWDGSGYSQGLSGPDIPEAARIVAIVDVYDALVHDRVYRPAFPEDRALDIMDKDRGAHFDPDLFAVFVQVLPRLRQIRHRIKGYDARGRSPQEGPPVSDPAATRSARAR